jgi:hypothetical protein
MKNYQDYQDNNGNVKSQDIIILQWKQSDDDKDIALRSHEFEFKINNEDYQEIVAHDQRTGGNDQVHTVQLCECKCITN